MFIVRALLVAVALLCAPTAFAVESFEAADIRIEGLQRISPGTVFNYLPIQVGDTIDGKRTAEAIKSLFRTGFFKDVRVERAGDDLVILVDERPAIATIEFEGNENIETEALLEGLKGIGLAEGQVFDRSLLDRVEQELRRQYFSEGKYGVRIESQVTPLERNRVGLKVTISEGRAARIKQINILGNTSYTDEELLDSFKLSVTTMFSFYTHNDQYSKQKLSADLEALRSWYLDRGFINFRIDSTQVSITPDKKDIFVTINVTEGDVFQVSEVRLSGEFSVEPEELVKLVRLRPGDVFSRKATTETSSALSAYLGRFGYSFANVNTVPDIDNDANTVNVTFFVDPGKRVYVRRVNMVGNTKTRDEVLRRELRQMEAGWISTANVERSRVRLRKLGFFESVNVETPAVADTPDQVDVNYSVTEQASGNLLAGLGFSQSQGLILNGSISQDNFLGSGKRVGASINTSDVNTVYRLSYTNPYHTIDGISRGFRVSYRETDLSEADITNYVTDVFGFGVNYGIPINEFDRFRFNIDYDHTEFKTGNDASDEVDQFIRDNGNKFDTIKIAGSWSRDTRNRAVFADRGLHQFAAAEISIPGGDLEYYTLSYKHHFFVPLTNSFTLSARGDFSYGDGYGDTDELPLFENFFAGGVKSVRGYEDFSLGPRASDGDPLGGDLKTVFNFDLIFPAPFQKETKSVQTSLFFDYGNVFGKDDDFAIDELRASTGLSIIWLSPVGPLKFVLAKPLNDEGDDDTQFFQFALGSVF